MTGVTNGTHQPRYPTRAVARLWATTPSVATRPTAVAEATVGMAHSVAASEGNDPRVQQRAKKPTNSHAQPNWQLGCPVDSHKTRAPTHSASALLYHIQEDISPTNTANPTNISCPGGSPALPLAALSPLTGRRRPILTGRLLKAGGWSLSLMMSERAIPACCAVSPGENPQAHRQVRGRVQTEAD